MSDVYGRPGKCKQIITVDNMLGEVGLNRADLKGELTFAGPDPLLVQTLNCPENSDDGHLPVEK